MKIAVAHPDRLTREALRRALNGSEFTLAWSAADNYEMRRNLRRQPADLILLDATMFPEFIAHAAQTSETVPSQLVLAPDERTEGVYEALSAGALGHLAPPLLDADGSLSGGSRLLARISRIQSLIGDQRALPAPPPMHASAATGCTPVLALGASTGGPLALARVLAGLPAGLDAAVLLVQHIDGEFSDGLVEWLTTHSLLPVQLARRGDLIESGRVYVSSAQGHLVLLGSQQIGYLAPRKQELHVPSVDMLFSSLADYPRRGAAALLTGMGSDGAHGLMQLRRAGWFTVAQDESSCTVFGMPRAAIDMGAAQQTLPLAAIGATLARQFGSSRAR